MLELSLRLLLLVSHDCMPLRSDEDIYDAGLTAREQRFYLYSRLRICAIKNQSLVKAQSEL